MPPWLSFIAMTMSASLTWLSLVGTNEAARTGRHRFVFWHIPGWGERERNPTFFKIVQAQNYYRTFFFALFTVVSGAFLLEGIGMIF